MLDRKMQGAVQLASLAAAGQAQIRASIAASCMAVMMRPMRTEAPPDTAAENAALAQLADLAVRGADALIARLSRKSDGS